MSRRNHHRSNSINVHELAEALTQRGWQPPNFPGNPNGQSNPATPQFNGNSSVNNSLSALTGLLGAVNGGNMSQGNNPPMQGNTPAMPGIMPQMPGNLPPMQGMMPMRQPAPSQPPSEHDLLKALFQQTLHTLKNE